MDLSFLLPIAVNFAIRQIEKYGQSLDMVKLRADFELRVKDLVPGTMWDDAAVAVADKIFNIFADLFTSEILAAVTEDLLDKKYAESFKHFQEYVLARIQK